MIFVVVLGLCCLGLVGYETLKKPGDPLVVMRAPVTGAWALSLLAYGINLSNFPQPSLETIVALTLTCGGAILMTAPWIRRAWADRPAHVAAAVPTWYRWALLLTVAFVALWDLYFIVERVSAYGWTSGLMIQRINRGDKAGAYALPGLEVLHAAAASGGALGLADWLATRRRLGLVTVSLALCAELFSTGRWDVVAYVIWLFSVYVFLSPRRQYRTVVWQLVTSAGLAVFFAAHGELLGKIDSAAALANGSTALRASQADVSVPVMMTGGIRSTTVTSPNGEPAQMALPPQYAIPCQRWIDGAAAANEGFRGLSRFGRVFVLYLAGPEAALDRALCENRMAQRVVLMYWPRKLLRMAGLRPPELVLVVDPFIEIGIPFNNYTAIYPVLAEVGPRLGYVAWIAFGALVGWFAAWAVARGTPSWIVAGTAPAAMALRTPWVNTFFDGTLAVWIVVALVPVCVMAATQRFRTRKSIS